MSISWTCSPKLCLQVRGSAGQGSVLQFWQPSPSAGPACSIWLLFHGLPCTGMLRGLPWLTPQSTALRIVSHCCTWQGGAKIGFWVFLMKNFPAWQCFFELVWSPPSGTCLWEGQGELESSQCYRGEWEQGCPVFQPSPSCISPWLLILAAPKHRQLPCAPSPA